MIENLVLPPELNAIVGSENKEFAVKASKAHSLPQALGLIIFGIFFISTLLIIFFGFLIPTFMGEEVPLKLNGKAPVANYNNLAALTSAGNVPSFASPSDPTFLIMPAVIIGILLIVGISISGTGIYFLFQKGGYFIGTPSRLIHYNGWESRSIDWEQFSGDISVSGSEQQGNLFLQLRTGRMVSRKNYPDEYVPEVVQMIGISNVFEIEKICRKRIKESDPTPIGGNQLLSEKKLYE